MSPSLFGRNAGVVFFCYLLGAMPFGFMAARLVGMDITRQGSGNTGATNVLRILGPVYAVPVLLLDVGKGVLSAYLGLRFLGIGTLGALIAGTAAIAGHNWSVFLKFRGGKGVAASAGVALVAFPMIFAVALGVFILTVLLTRYVSLGSLLGSFAAMIVSFTPGYTLVHRAPVFILVCLIAYQHRSNVQRLLKGTENKIGAKADRSKVDHGGAGP